MQLSLLKLAVVVVSSPQLVKLVAAQTWTECNPLETTCKPDPALSGTYEHKYGGEAPDFTILAGKDVIIYGDEGAAFRVEKTLDAPTIVSDWYIMWGKVEVTLKAAPGPGIISSVVLQSDDLDEIDWEWVGVETTQAQSNYFGKGNTESYDRGAFHPVDGQASFHKYGIEWTAEKTDWLIDDVVVRTLYPAQSKGFYPQTPCQLRLGSWAAGDPSNDPGVISWSGGPTDYSKGPFDMIVKDIWVQDYSSGTEYVYTDKSGSWQSIQAVNGKVGAGPQTGAGNDIPDNDNDAAVGAGDGTFKAPTKSGRIVSSGASQSEPTPVGGSGNNADSAETTPAPSSDSYSPVYGGAGELWAGPSGFATGTGGAPVPTANVTNPHPAQPSQYTGSATKALPASILLGTMGLVMGWLI